MQPHAKLQTTRSLSPDLCDAGNSARPHSQLTWSARVCSSDSTLHHRVLSRRKAAAAASACAFVSKANIRPAFVSPSTQRAAPIAICPSIMMSHFRMPAIAPISSDDFPRSRNRRLPPPWYSPTTFIESGSTSFVVRTTLDGVASPAGIASDAGASARGDVDARSADCVARSGVFFAWSISSRTR